MKNLLSDLLSIIKRFFAYLLPSLFFRNPSDVQSMEITKPFASATPPNSLSRPKSKQLIEEIARRRKNKIVSRRRASFAAKRARANRAFRLRNKCNCTKVFFEKVLFNGRVVSFSTFKSARNRIDFALPIRHDFVFHNKR